MPKKIPSSQLGIVVMFGAIWGLSETALGMGLRSCASMASGSIMTGVALFFMAATWMVSRNVLGLCLLIVVASLFKMLDALLLSLPLQHGAVANPIFAFLMEGLAFLILIGIAREKLKQNLAGQAILGGTTALLAVNLFPLVKFATGIPACVFPGTSTPLSLYYAPLAICLSLITVPLGFWVGKEAEDLEPKIKVFSPATLILCLAVIILMRLS